MGVNPNKNKIEKLYPYPLDRDITGLTSNDNLEDVAAGLLRADGSPVPKHWTILKQGELIDIKGYTFRIEYIGETAILLEPVKPTNKIVDTS